MSSNEHQGSNDTHQSPFAKYAGVLQFGPKAVDCYVLDTGERVVSLRGTVKALSGTDMGKLSDYLAVKALQPFLAARMPARENQGSEERKSCDNNTLVAGESVQFTIPGNPQPGRGLTSDQFLSICYAYVDALGAGALTTDRQREIAINSATILGACARIGLIALIDEATGYQEVRAKDVLQLKLQAYISEELRAWNKTFPDELWELFGRLTRWQGALHLRPKWWGKLVNELVYDAMDPEVAEYLRTNKPPSTDSARYHQWLTEDFGLKRLQAHIQQLLGIGKTCFRLDEFREQVRLAFTREPAQLRLRMSEKPNRSVH